MLNDFAAQARDLLFRLADQIGTITTKYHHKELDYDETNTWSNRYQEQALVVLLALHEAALRQAEAAARDESKIAIAKAMFIERVETMRASRVLGEYDKQLKALRSERQAGTENN